MKKRTIVFTLLCALGAFAPALAYGWQDHHADGHGAAGHGQTHGDHAAQGEAGEAGEHGGGEGKGNATEGHEHGPAPINWFDFSNKEQPPYGAMLINFAILMVMYYSLGKKPVAEALKARRASIAKEIEEAQRMRHEAEERALKYQEKLKNLEHELKDTREAMKAAGEVERDRVVRDAEEKAARLERDAKFLVEQELKQMRVELTREAVEMATAAAEDLLRKRITPADQERLAEDYLSELTAKRPGSAEARPSMAPGGE
jgi:F-type H+-transporting ATPase subunit b